MESKTSIQFPRIAIKFCVQCKWNLRAAYYAQELLQTFSNTIGEISLIPVTGGTFTITLYHRPISSTGDNTFHDDIQEHLIWDRKRDGGFPETKELKNRVRNVVDPERDMGHVDRALRKGVEGQQGQEKQEEKQKEKPGAEGAGGGTAYVDLIGSMEKEKEGGISSATASKGGETGSDQVDQTASGHVADDCEECKEANKS